MEWEWTISVLVILGLILALLAKISNQTVMDLIRDFTEYLKEVKENSTQRVVEI